MASDDLPGWISNGDRLVPLMTVAGCVARGEAIYGHCKTAECRRRVELDLRRQVALGFGKSDIATVKAAYRCHAGICRLEWLTGQYPDGVPLQFYVGEGVTVTVTCLGCGHAKGYSAPKLIAILKKRRTGDGNTSVNRIAEAIRGACPFCQAHRWKADVQRPHAQGQGSV